MTAYLVVSEVVKGKPLKQNQRDGNANGAFVEAFDVLTYEEEMEQSQNNH